MIRKIRNYYRSLQQPVKASFWSLICGFGQKGISMLTIPIFIRVMSDAEYGRYSVYHSWLSIVELIVTLDLAGSVYTRGLIANENDQDRFSSSMLGLSTTCILIWSAVYFIFQKSISNLLGMNAFLAVAMLLEIWAHSAYQFWSNRERANFRYKKLVVLTFTYVILRPVMGICFVMMADPARQVEARVSAIILVNVTLFALLYISIMRKGRQFYSRKYWVYALGFVIPLLPHGLSQLVLGVTDRLMINHFCGPTETAYYSVAYTLAMVLQILNSAVFASLNPWIYRKIKSAEYEKIGKVSYGILLLIALANLGVVFVAPELLGFIAPANYRDAVWIIPPVTLSVFFMYLYNLFVVFEYYFEKTHYVTIATVCAAGLNILLNVVCIPKFGFIAAGYTTLVCYMLCAFMHYYFLQKISQEYMDGKVVFDPRRILILSGILLISAFLLVMMYKQVILRYFLLAAMALVVFFNRNALISSVAFLKNRKEQSGKA